MQPKNPEGTKKPSSPAPPDRASKRGPDSAPPSDEELDAELEQTFPASDPLPWTHRVD
jgi:hypothetical protein